jgi:hypothetical protein
MRRTAMWASLLALAAIGVSLPGAASAQSVSIGVQTNNAQLGIHLGPTPPPLVAVPGAQSVYYAPNLPYNYFVYQHVYYLYHDARWFRGRHYDGPWRAIAIDEVPRPVLAVPVDHYRNRPGRWAHHGPPPWAHEREREHRWEQAHGRGQDRGPHGRGHGEERG